LLGLKPSACSRIKISRVTGTTQATRKPNSRSHAGNVNPQSLAVALPKVIFFSQPATDTARSKVTNSETAEKKHLPHPVSLEQANFFLFVDSQSFGAKHAQTLLAHADGRSAPPVRPS
jgi:hypothetical protein